MNIDPLPPPWAAYVRFLSKYPATEILLFSNPPDALSSPYLAPPLSEAPNIGPHSLLECETNQEFLTIQLFTWKWLHYIEQFPQALDQACIQALHRCMEMLENKKKEQWDTMRRNAVLPPPQYLQDGTYHPLVALLMFIPPYLNTNFGLSRTVVQLIYQNLKDVLRGALNTTPLERNTIMEELNQLPQNFGSLYDMLGFDNTDCIYVSCPKCSALYDPKTFVPICPPSDLSVRNPLPPAPPPKSTKTYTPLENSSMPPQTTQIPWAPAQQYRCTYQVTPNQSPCNTLLMRSRSSGEVSQELTGLQKPGPLPRSIKSKLVPRLPYNYSSVVQFLSRIVMQPGMVELLSSSLPDSYPTEMGEETQVRDIMDSAAIRSIKADDHSMFATQIPGELRLCLGLFIDWYNARGNSLRGGKHSTGGVYVVVLNLPLHLRYQKKNMYKLFLPGPREQNTQAINHCLRPLVNDLIDLFKTGFYFFNGSQWLCRAALAIVIADLLGAKKICGFAAVNHQWFCPYCRLPHEQIASSLNEGSPLPAPVTRQQHLDIIKAWRDAPTEKEADAIFERWGFRYTELARLEYFDILKQTVIEGFHALLPNIAQPHCRTLMGTRAQEDNDDLASDDDDDSLSDDSHDLNQSEDFSEVDENPSPDGQLEAALSFLRRPNLDPTALRQLERMHRSILEEICRQKHLLTWMLPHHGQSPSKSGMILMLAAWCDSDQRKAQDIDIVDVSTGVATLDMDATVAVKKGHLEELDSSVLLELCLQKGINTSSFRLDKNSLYPHRDTMIEALLNSAMARGTPCNTPVAIEQWIGTMKPQTRNTIKKINIFSPLFNPTLQKAARADIKDCILSPELSHDKPPANLGSKSHGSLKAAQWRVVACYTMPITLAKHWLSPESWPHHRHWFQNFTHLVAMIQIAYYRTIDFQLIGKFRHHCSEYVKGLKDVFPVEFIKPSHHYLLHLADSLERFGPMPGWWAFAFERLNGFVQRTKTNNKLGQIETTFATRMNRYTHIGIFLDSTKITTLQGFEDTANLIKSIEKQAETGLVSIDQSTHELLQKHAKIPLAPRFRTLPTYMYNALLFKSSSKPNPHSLVEFSGTDVFQQTITCSLGFIKTIVIHQQPNSTEKKILLSIAKYRDTEQESVEAMSCINAQFYSTEVEHHLLFNCEAVELKRIVVSSWNAKKQLAMRH